MFTMMPTPLTISPPPPPPPISNYMGSALGSGLTHSTASVTPISTPRHSPHTSIDSTGRAFPSNNISPGRHHTSSSFKPTTPPRQAAKPFLKRNSIMSDTASIKSTSTSASRVGESSNPPSSMGFLRKALDAGRNNSIYSSNNNNNSKLPSSIARNAGTTGIPPSGIPPSGKGRTHQRVVSGGDMLQIKSSLAKKKLYSYAPYIHTYIHTYIRRFHMLIYFSFL